MKIPRVTIKASKRISVRAVRELLRRNKWHGHFTDEDIRWYVDHALYVVSAWSGRRAIGLAVLTGDGRINTWLDTVIVDEAWRGRGIGTELVSRIVSRVERLKPYYFQLDVYQKRTERFYRRFGFVPNEGTWLLEHNPTAGRLRSTQNTGVR